MNVGVQKNKIMLENFVLRTKIMLENSRPATQINRLKLVTISGTAVSPGWGRRLACLCLK